MNLPFPHFKQQLVVLEYVRCCDVGKYAALIGSDRAAKIDKHVWLLRALYDAAIFESSWHAFEIEKHAA